MKVVLLLAVALLAPRPPQDASPKTTQPQRATATAESAAGLWPSPKLTKLLLMRWADQLGYKYDLDDAQQQKLQKAIVDRWAPFLQENRSKLEPVLNEFLEMRLDRQPPTKDQLQTWANKALPALELFNGQVGEVKKDLREILEPAQRVKLEVDALELGMGLKIAEARIRTLQSGSFDPADFREFWQPPVAERRRLREERKADRAAAKSDEPVPPDPNRGLDLAADTERVKSAEPTDQIAVELESWEKYVTDFAKLYKLDDGQRTTARSVLKEMRDRALAHRDLHREEIDRLEQRIAHTAPDTDMKEIEAQLTKLYGPIDEMFQELKDRLESIPTTEQRAAAKQAQSQKEPVKKPPPDSKTKPSDEVKEDQKP